MNLDHSSGYAASSDLQVIDPRLPIFTIESVQLQFPRPSNFVAAQVANNVLILAFASGRIIRIDLDSAGEAEDIYLPKRPTEIGEIRHMFLDPTASHLIITTTFGENFYLHSQSRQPKALSRLKGLSVECISWNPSQTTSSTREILLGTSDGNVYETYIEPSPKFYRREEKYVKAVYKTADGPVVGIWTDIISAQPNICRVLVATPVNLLHFVGEVGQHAHEGSCSIFSRYFQSEAPTVHEVPKDSALSTSCLAVSPEAQDEFSTEITAENRNFAWLSSQGVFHGELLKSSDTSGLGSKVYADSKMLARSRLPPSLILSSQPRMTQEPVTSMILSQWHIIQFVQGRIIATSRLDDTVVFDQLVLQSGQSALGLFADSKKNTFWLVTEEEVFEIDAKNESRDIWKIMLKAEQFNAALQFAKTAVQKDVVATASGDYLVNRKQYVDAAAVYGRSTKPLEEVALTFIHKDEQDALRKYLLTKLSTLKKSAIMQRMMLAAWLVELYMVKLNILDDTITIKAGLVEGTNTAEGKDQISAILNEYQDFVTKYKCDLDSKTTYETISSHGREEELLFFATVIDDYNYILTYWVQRERWPESLAVLKKKTDPAILYRYSSVLMANVPVEFVDILIRKSNLDVQRLIPALLNYNKIAKVPLNQNQAIRYLNFVITQLQSTDSVVHNTLISIYATSPSRDESALLSYLRVQSYAQEQYYDADFALRLCIQHQRIHSCIHIYISMSQYLQAVDLALKYNDIELASLVAERCYSNAALRKKLWLAVAKKAIAQSERIKTAIDLLKSCELLRIEDLIPFFPDFIVIDDFKEGICQALEEYSRHIDTLKKEMDESALTVQHIKTDIKALNQHYAIVEPGERCYICRLPLLARQFFVFPCQHAFHSNCLGQNVIEQAGVAKRRRIRELRVEVARGIGVGTRKEKAVRSLDSLVASACVLCNDVAIEKIDEPFVLAAANRDEWAL